VFYKFPDDDSESEGARLQFRNPETIQITMPRVYTQRWVDQRDIMAMCKQNTLKLVHRG
jgi:hypothetical protein